MYKKQLFLIVFAYLMILFATACGGGGLEQAAEVIPLPVVEQVEAIESQPVDRTTSADDQPASQMSDDSKLGNQMAGNGMADNAMTDTSMSGNEMNNQMSAKVSADTIPEITDFPDEDIDTMQERDALNILVQDRYIALVLANNAGWHVEMWHNEEWGAMEIDLFDSNWEWVAWGAVSLAQNGIPQEVLEITAPRPLSAEEYQQGQAMVEDLVLNEPEVLAILGDPADWERWTWYDEWESSWEVGFYKGIDEFVVRVVDYGEGFMVDSIVNSVLLAEEQQVFDNQNRAIEIAWGAEGIDEAIYGSGEDLEWFTYVSALGGTEYGVSFSTEEGELFFAHVDLATESVISSQP